MIRTPNKANTSTVIGLIKFTNTSLLTVQRFNVFFVEVGSNHHPPTLPVKVQAVKRSNFETTIQPLKKKKKTHPFLVGLGGGFPFSIFPRSRVSGKNRLSGPYSFFGGGSCRQTSEISLKENKQGNPWKLFVS